MKNMINYIFLVFVFLFIFSINVFAECSYKERKDLLDKAKKIQIVVQPKIEKEETTGKNSFEREETTYLTETYSFDFLISNLSEDLYIEYSSDYDIEEKFIVSEDMVDGIFKFNVEDYQNLDTYYFNISTFNENCRGAIIKSVKVVKPKFNEFSTHAICENELVRNKEYCKMFISKDLNMNEAEFIEKANKVIKSHEGEQEEVVETFDILSFIKEYIWIFISVIIVAIIVVTIVIINKRRGRLV